MTVVIGYTEGNKTYMACDSYVDWGWTRGEMGSKIHALPDKTLIGVSGNMGTLSVIQYMELTPPSDSSSFGAWLQTKFVPTLRETLQNQLKLDDGVQVMDSSILIGHSGSLYALSRNFALVRIARSAHALGNGTDAALGALHAVRDNVMEPKQRLQIALEAALHVSTMISSPFYFYGVGNE